MNRYVQHISGQGDKWEVYDETALRWHAGPDNNSAFFSLPKSEYRLCDPPDLWRIITPNVYIGDNEKELWYHGTCIAALDPGYRFGRELNLLTIATKESQ